LSILVFGKGDDLKEVRASGLVKAAVFAHVSRRWWILIHPTDLPDESQNPGVKYIEIHGQY
jgi:hypothetical protein